MFDLPLLIFVQVQVQVTANAFIQMTPAGQRCVQRKVPFVRTERVRSCSQNSRCRCRRRRCTVRRRPSSEPLWPLFKLLPPLLLQGGPSGPRTVDFKFKLMSQYKLLILKCKFRFEVNKRLSAIRCTTLYPVLPPLCCL